MAAINSNYKAELDKLLQKKRNEMPTSFSEAELEIIFNTIEYTPLYLTALAERYDDKSLLKPIIEGKHSFRETMIHLLNFLVLLPKLPFAPAADKPEEGGLGRGSGRRIFWNKIYSMYIVNFGADFKFMCFIARE